MAAAATQIYHRTRDEHGALDMRLGYFYAMTCWRLGRSEQAHEYYALTTRLFQAEAQEEQARFRLEAEMLLQIDDSNRAGILEKYGHPERETAPGSTPSLMR